MVGEKLLQERRHRERVGAGGLRRRGLHFRRKAQRDGKALRGCRGWACKLKPMFDREKFKRLVHYVIWRAGNRAWFGAVKLNKVLWFADTEAFAHTGEPITGANYTVRAVYVIEPACVVVKKVVFEDSVYMHAGRA